MKTKGYGVRDEIGESRTPRPTWEDQLGRFPERLKEAVKGEPLRAFASRADVNEGTLRNLLSGGLPKLDSLVRIAGAAGVSVQWLATGEGAMRPGEPGAGGLQADELDLLQDIVEVTDELLEEYGIRLSGAKRARVYRLLLELAREDETPAVDREKVVQLIRLAS
jgi:transcriptional regulator with XRE-family HTH domain